MPPPRSPRRWRACSMISMAATSWSPSTTARATARAQSLERWPKTTRASGSSRAAAAQRRRPGLPAPSTVGSPRREVNCSVAWTPTMCRCRAALPRNARCSTPTRRSARWACRSRPSPRPARACSATSRGRTRSSRRAIMRERSSWRRRSAIRRRSSGAPRSSTSAASARWRGRRTTISGSASMQPGSGSRRWSGCSSAGASTLRA